ncbi:MAG: hypothetical protein D6713_00245 [Deltaproteobacteria bacterium]|nr:MAG: hypothetical protein D6713_00245 [Deltaproteobacteria bacterium]
MSKDTHTILTGYNHNIKYRDKVYHVQTEDGGITNPFVRTSLFFEGMVVDVIKVSYEEYLGEGGEALKEKVRELMKKQHLIMIKRVMSGYYEDSRDGGDES